MNNEFSTIEDQLNKVSVQNLSNDEKQTLWVSIVHEHTARPVVSPYSWMLLVHRRLMVTVSAILIFILAGGSTVALADSAKPGDTLFALDRATEDVVLALVSEDSKDNVRVAMVNERIDELESLISDESSRRLARVEIGDDARAKEAPEASLMMATLAVEEATGTDDANMQAEDDGARAFSKQAGWEDSARTEIGEPAEMKDKKRSDIEEALSQVNTISVELEKKGNREGHDLVERARGRLNEKLGELPHEDNDSFRKSFERVFSEDRGGDEDEDKSGNDDRDTNTNDDSDHGVKGSVSEELFPTDPTLDSSGTSGSVQGDSIRIDDNSDNNTSGEDNSGSDDSGSSGNRGDDEDDD